MPDHTNKFTKQQNGHSRDTQPGHIPPQTSPAGSRGCRLLHAWIRRSQTNLHLLLALLFLLTYAAGALLKTSGVPEQTTGLLQTVGTTGLFILLLLALLHQNLHGSRNFLEMFRNADHLPARQLGEVSSFCMVILLTAAALLMTAGAWIMPLCWSLLTSLFAGRTSGGSMDISDLNDMSPKHENPDLTALADNIRPTPAWVRLLEQLLFLFGTVLIVLLLLAAFWTIARKICQVLTRRRPQDDDEKISLAPSLRLSDYRRPKIPAAPRRRLFEAASPNEKIRRCYRRRIGSGLHFRHASPNPWETPEELEASAGIQDTALHLLYEKARYSHTACTAEEAQAITKTSD